MAHNILTDFYYSIFPNSDKYLTYAPGKTNIILSAPHGGGIKPSTIPARTTGNRSGDTYTRRLIQRVVELMHEKPYFIYADIHRSRVDLNRKFSEATDGNYGAEKIWMKWNTTLADYVTKIRNKYGKGLYIDLHSHNNNELFQIGYGLTVNSYLNLRKGLAISSKSTMYPLKVKGKSEFTTLFGNGSMIRTLENRGFRVLVPEAEDKYLNGGRNIKAYSGGGIGAMQIECPIPVLKSDLEEVAMTIVEGIERFQEKFL